LPYSILLNGLAFVRAGFFIMVNLICLSCSKNFIVKNSEAKTRKTCGLKCKFIYQKTKTGNLNNNWRGGIKSNNCIVCNKDFIPNRSNLGQKTCSPKCNGINRFGKHNSRYNPNDQRLICECGGKKNKISIKCNICRLKDKSSKNKLKPIIYSFCICGNKKTKSAKNCISCSKIARLNLKECITCGKKFKFHPNQKNCSRECGVKYMKKTRGGELNSNWKGGRLTINQKIRASELYKEWRIAVFTRDKYTCQECGQIGHSLHAHHIKSFSQFPDLRMELSNGITLCEICHSKKHSNMNHILKRIIK
jgi:predicted nucleic acid-binding Zn ribbon protein